MSSYIGKIFTYTDKVSYERIQTSILFEDDLGKYTEVDLEPQHALYWRVVNGTCTDHYTYAHAHEVESSGGYNLLIFPPTSDIWDEIWPSGRVIK